MAQITYTNKVALNENPEIANINKVTDDDMNEIKQVVNDNYNNTIQITDTEPTDSDNKIWIDTGEIGSAVSEITNEYSTSTGLGYSANYVNTELDKKITNETTQSTVSQCTFYKIGKIVIASGWFVINDASATFTAPYKPVSRLWIPTNGVDNSVNPSASNGFIDILDTGNISIKMTSAVTYCTATFCYITND